VPAVRQLRRRVGFDLDRVAGVDDPPPDCRDPVAGTNNLAERWLQGGRHAPAVGLHREQAAKLGDGHAEGIRDAKVIGGADRVRACRAVRDSIAGRNEAGLGRIEGDHALPVVPERVRERNVGPGELGLKQPAAEADGVEVVVIVGSDDLVPLSAAGRVLVARLAHTAASSRVKSMSLRFALMMSGAQSPEPGRSELVTESSRLRCGLSLGIAGAPWTMTVWDRVTVETVSSATAVTTSC
jgi:hypothetical protein